MDIIIWDSQPDMLFDPEDQFTLILSQELFDQFKDFEKAARIFILAELDWHPNMKMHSFHGFELLKQLRIDGIRVPIIMCSILERSYFLDLGQSPYGFLNLPHSNAFIQIPAEESILKTADSFPLKLVSTQQLEDAVSHFADPHGMLNEIIHDLKNKIQQDPQAALDQALVNLRKLIPSNNLPAFDHLAANFREAIEQEPRSLSKLVTQKKLDFVALLNNSPRQFAAVEKILEWQILFIDDNPNQRETVQKNFRDRGIQCITAGTGEEAIQILEMDYRGELPIEGYPDQFHPQNSITVVICDLRFINEANEWHPMQGYDIIDHIYYKLSNFVCFYMLTSKDGSVSENAAKPRRIQVKWLPKGDVLYSGSENGFNRFFNQVKLDGTNMLRTICSFPKANYWATSTWKGKLNYHLQTYYRQFRLSDNYSEKDNWISDCAEQYIFEAELVKEEMHRNKTKVDELDFSFQFMAGIKNNAKDPDSMEKFYVKLIGRRIAIGLYFKQWEEGEISDILKYQEFRDHEVDRQLLTNYLALATKLSKIIPGQILVEERNWVEQSLGVSLDPIDRNFFDQLKRTLELVQEVLYKNGCADDFVERSIFIGNREMAHTLIKEAAELTKEYRSWSFFQAQMGHILDDKNGHFKDAIRRNGIHSLFQEISRNRIP